MKTIWREEFLYLLFGVILAVLLADAAGGFLNQDWAEHIVFDLLKVLLPLVLLVTHSAYFLSLKRSLVFILFLCLGGLIAEVIGLKTGILFGGYYHYLPGSLMIFSGIPLFSERLFFWGVPLPVVFYWAVFIYAAYSISNSFLVWQSKEKPSYKNKDIKLLGKLIALDLWVVLAIDLMMDPLLVESGNWQWEKPGIYFGVPLGNFIGWMIVTACLAGGFRIFEYKFPNDLKRGNRFITLLPVLCLSALFILGTGIALQKKLSLLIPITALTMLPVILLNLRIFFTKKPA
jgi:uncharacterized membrane protein